MRVLTLEGSGRIYTSRVYLVLGDWSSLEDVNTLVDVGQDPAAMAGVERLPTPVGNRRVKQVVLTHRHSEHCALLPFVREKFHPTVCAFSPSLEGVDRVLGDGDRLKMGDRLFEVIHAPGHSSDSICLYNEDEGVLFAGDAPLLVHSPEEAYEEGFLRALERLCEREVRVIYFGHGDPLRENCNLRLRRSLELIRRSRPSRCGERDCGDCKDVGRWRGRALSGRLERSSIE